MGEQIVAYLDERPMILWTAVAPFNFIKGLLISLITFVLYKRLSPFIKKGLKA
jgi:riboflavin transporter FmnP